ncbi:Gfo/Idh/MocA family protein [Pseudoroseicyclus aestuarii]|uniref:Putative dehydrogenase n=1 Tax=Pseudoroseicyclus aestuarii TaxID=1795041 RepID=A0A318SSA1_9RHOB|nr:Gfo/Idh/MocA family oxidoreductase [Pseudoroseicyclus aestuarii]PYE80616.1 putative dehydrogenase [Pseudoroseicyclus aestuarii]
MRTVLVGCGAMSDGWLSAIRDTPALATGIEMVGFVDLDPERAAAQARAYGHEGASCGSDLAAMLEDLRPDAVFDLVVPPARRAVVETALAHGCHVLSEKPMANDMDEARALLAAAREAGRIRAVIQNRRHLPGIRRAKALIDSGALGQITAIHSDFFLAPHFGGFRDEMEHVLLLDMAVHTFDAARFLLPSEPTAVYCQETNPAGSWYAHGASANAIFDCAGGATFTYRGSWCAEGAPTAWEAQWRIIGTKGSALWDGNEGLTASVVDGEEGFFRPLREIDVPPAPDLPATGHAGVILDFLRAVQGGDAPLTVDHDNIHSLSMVFAAIDSAKQGRRIDIKTQEGAA